MRFLGNLTATALLVAATFFGTAALAQTPDYANVGRTPTPEEIKAWDISIGLEGKELPPGSGTAKQGEPIFMQKCAVCHGEKLEGGRYLGAAVPALAGGFGTLKSDHPLKTVGSYWPFPTTVYDFINRSMPREQERTLKPEQIYAIVAFIFYKNNIIGENDVMDAKTLPKVKMPNRDNFIPKDFDEINNWKKRGCKWGQCPD